MNELLRKAEPAKPNTAPNDRPFIDVNRRSEQGIMARMTVERYEETGRDLMERAALIREHGLGVTPKEFADALLLRAIFQIWESEGHQRLTDVMLSEMGIAQPEVSDVD